MKRLLFAASFLALPSLLLAAEPADLIVYKAKVVTVDAKFSLAEALAVKDGRIVFVGTDAEALKHCGKNTKLIDAAGKPAAKLVSPFRSHP